jgi:hypothetical protein
VSWWSVHEYVSVTLEQVGLWPMVGTPEWCALADGDPVKLAALLDAAQHHALRLELNQESRAEASHAISAAACRRRSIYREKIANENSLIWSGRLGSARITSP